MIKTSGPLEAVARINKRRKERSEEVLLASQQLPLWGEAKRGLPNVLARSALFNARRNVENGDDARVFFKNSRIASLSNYEITYRGEELRQDDASVFMQLLHLARQQPLGDRVYFTAYSMIKQLAWSVCGANYKRLKECIERLAANTVKIQFKDERSGYGKSLIRAFYWKDNASGEDLREWCVEFEKEIIFLFGDDAYTLIEWHERRLIGSRSTLALWLHNFLATHSQPIPLSVAKYHELSESSFARLFHFREALKKALKRLSEIGFVKEYQINSADLVEITLYPREARQRQIAAASN